MERTEFQQMMAELKEKSERRRYEALRKKYAVAPDFSNMSLIDELNVRNELDDLEQFNKKYGFGQAGAIEKTLTVGEPPVQQPAAYGDTKVKELDEYRNYIDEYLPSSFLQSYDVLNKAKDEMDVVNTLGADNYYHSVGMCENTQAGRPVSTLTLGAAKEVYDFWNKTKEGKPIGETLLDNTKDMGNNIRGVYYGLRYPNQSCRDIFQRLDWKTNKMR